MDDNKIKESVGSTIHKKCICTNLHGLFIPNRQLSFAVSICIFLFFVTFVVGYFLGKQHAAQDFIYKIDHTIFNDQVSTSLYALAKEYTTIPSNDNDIVYNQSIEHKIEEDVNAIKIASNDKKYYAQLIGFSTQQAAQYFAKKLEKKDIIVEIKKHTSKTAQGKIRHWYQVVTLPYEDHDKLLELVEIIKKTEKIKDIRIVMC